MDNNDHADIAVLQEQVKKLSADVEALTASTKELIEAWRAAGTVVRLVKLLAAMATAVSAIFAAWHFSATKGL